MAESERCVAHPSRPSVDHCPTCQRPRCGADAGGRRCAVCSVDRSEPVVPAAPPRELLVRAALAAHVTALAIGLVLSEYPGSPYFAYLAPLVGGMAVTAAATAAAAEPRGPLLRSVRAVGVLYALLATALGFVIEGTYAVAELSPRVLLPYALAAAGAWYWTRPPAGQSRQGRGRLVKNSTDPSA